MEKIKKVHYYALVSYRGIIKHYRVNHEYEDEVYISYLDFNENREWRGVNVKKSRIIKKFKKGTKVFEYFNQIQTTIDSLLQSKFFEIKEKNSDSDLPDIFHWYSMGTNFIKNCYKKAYKETPNPNNININLEQRDK